MYPLSINEGCVCGHHSRECSCPSPNGVKQDGMTAEQLFQQALAKVESESIRQWATSEHNQPLWLKMAQGAIEKHHGSPDVSLFSALIVSTAIGL